MNDAIERAKQSALEAFVRELTANPTVGGVFLFGSYARGDSRPDSDIDLVVVHSGPFSKEILHRDGVEFEVFYNNEAATVEFWKQHPDEFTRFWADAQVLFDRDGSTVRLEAAAHDLMGNTADMADTPALRVLAELGIPFEVTEATRSNSVEEAATKRGIAVGQLIKTIVVRRGDDDFLFVLVPGDRGIDWAKLRAHLGVRRMNLPDAEEALAVTGYERGTITPFGATTAWPVIADSSIDPDTQVSIGGGAHGVSVKMQAHHLIEAVSADVVDVTKPLG